MNEPKFEFKNNTAYSALFDDFYFSKEGALKESEYVFLKANNIPEIWKNQDKFIIAECGFGAGINFLNTYKFWINDKQKSNKLHFVSIEAFPLSKESLIQIHKNFEELNIYFEKLINLYPPLVKGIHRLEFENGRIVLDLCFFDIEQILPELCFEADVWFMDGFAPSKNEKMWSEKVIKEISRLSKINTKLSSFSANSTFRKRLEKYGFDVQKKKGFGKKREMVTAKLTSKSTTEKNPWFALPKTNIKEKTALVLGAGIAGCTVANSLAKRNWKVTLIDKQGVAAGASGNHCGAISPLITKPNVNLGEFYMQAFLYATCFYKDFDEVGLDGSYQYIFNEKLKERYEIWKKENNPLIKCIDETLYSMSAFFIENSGWARPKILCEKLAKHQNINLKIDEIISIEFKNNKWQANCQQNSFKAEVIIIALGFNSLDFLENDIELKKLRGQISYIKPSFKTNVPHSANGYICPVFEDKQVIGATYKRNDSETNIRVNDHIENLKNVRLFLGDNASTIEVSSLEGRVSFRSSTLDRFPLIGAIAQDDWYKKTYKALLWHKNKETNEIASYLPNAFISSAHGSRGLITAPFAAELITNIIENEPLNIEKRLLDEVHLMRFIIRKLKKGLI